MSVFVAVLAFMVASEYAVIGFYIVPRLAGIARVERRTVAFARWGATAFLAGCAVTHTVIGLQTLFPALRGGMDMDMAASGSNSALLWEMVLPHIAQILGGAVFIWICQRRLEVSITTKDQAAEQRELDRQLKAAFHRSPLGIAFSTASAAPGASQYVNPAYLDILGATDSSAPAAADLLAVVDQADRAAVVDTTTRTRAGEPADLEFRLRRPDGAVRWVHARWNPVTDQEGRAGHRLVAIVEDVTERVNAHAALLDSERRFVQLASSVAVGINLRQLHPPKFLWANASYRQIVGVDPAQATSTPTDPALVLIHPDDHERVITGYWSAAQAGQMAESEHRVLRPDGQVRWVHVTSNPVLDESGVINRVAGTVEDITDRKTSEQVLLEERRRLNDAEVIGHLGSWERDLQSGVLVWSDGMFRLWGMDRATFDGDYTAAREHIHPDDRPMLNAAVEACINTGEPIRVRYRITRLDDGAARWIQVTGEARYDNGRRVRIGGVLADVTEQVLAVEEAEASNSFHRAVIDASPDVVFVYDVSTRSTTWTNRSLLDQLGYPAAGDITSDIDVDSLIPDEEQAQVAAAMAAAADTADEEVIQLDHRLRDVDGTDRWFSRRVTAMRRDHAGRATELVGVLRDITAAMAAEQHLRHTALHDNLTGLPNRALLMDRLDSALTRAERTHREISVLFCDLDGFKRINDSAGHAAGDQVLLEIADRLTKVIREGDTVARIGGDEFVIIIEPWNRPGGNDQPVDAAADRALAARVAERVGVAVRQPITINGVEHGVSVSIGITHCTQPQGANPGPLTAEQILQNADTAMYRAKSWGKDRFEVFDPGMRADVAERGRVERILRDALRLSAHPEHGHPVTAAVASVLSAAYQPIFDAGTGALVGFEALARLADTHGFTIGPDVFIPIAEDTGLIRALGTRMLDLACGQLATWLLAAPGHPNLTMAVNMSALQAQHSSLADDVHRALTKHGLAASSLILELTETTLLDAANSTIKTLKGLHEDGIGIAIDDFGTGYASLRYLATLPISALKIDRSFTCGLPEDTVSRKIVNAVAGLAADLELDCIVEGVETNAQRDALPSGVQLQGYLTGRPQQPDLLDVPTLAAQTSGRDRVAANN